MKFFLSCMLFTESIGGGETLFIRMARWMRNKGYTPCLLLDNNICVASNLKKSIDDENIEIIKLFRDKMSIRIMDEGLGSKLKNSNAEVVTVSYTLLQHELCDSLFHKHSNRKSILYNINWGDSFVLKGNAIGARIMNSYIKDLLKTNSYFCMDNVCRDIVASFSGIEKKQIPIALLGIEIDQKYAYKKRNENLSILTVTRMVFPFKGYVLGLIQDFALLCDQYDVNLVIIGDGDGLNEVNAKIGQLEEDIRNRISLMPSVPYQQLKDIYSKADIYVGMGTTLLEASKNALPSIVANAYQYSNSSPGFFSDTHAFGYPITGEFSSYIDKSVAEKDTFYDLLKRILDLPEKEYQKYREKSYDEFYKMFSMDQMMNTIISARYTQKHFGINRLLSLYKKKKNLSDFRRRENAGN